MYCNKVLQCCTSRCSKWKADKRAVHCVCCHSNNELLLSAGRNIKLWNLVDHTLIKVSHTSGEFWVVHTICHSFPPSLCLFPLLSLLPFPTPLFLLCSPSTLPPPFPSSSSFSPSFSSPFPSSSSFSPPFPSSSSFSPPFPFSSSFSPSFPSSSFSPPFPSSFSFSPPFPSSFSFSPLFLSYSTFTSFLLSPPSLNRNSQVMQLTLDRSHFSTSHCSSRVQRTTES